MKMETFKIDKKKRYIIYGAGGDGIKTAASLAEQNVDIWGYIDARGDTIRYIDGCQVCTLQKAAEMIDDKENYVVIITIKNLFEHSRVSRNLARTGFSQVIYKPVEVLKGIGTEAQKRIGEVYDRIVLQIYIHLNDEISKTDAELKISCKDNLLITSNEQSVTVWLPEELIYNYDDLQDAYGGINMPVLFPLVELYRLFMGQYKEEDKVQEVTDNFIFYAMEWMKREKIDFNNELKHSLIRSRNNVFVEMQRVFEIDQEFFVRNAPSVCRGGRGGFYMSSSGRNRVAFLLARDFHYIPVRMSEADYCSWVNQEGYMEILKYMEQKNMDTFEGTIAHPFLSSISVKYTEYMHLFCVKCLNILVKQFYARSRVKDGKVCVIDKSRLEENKQREKIGCFLMDYGCMRRYLNMNGLYAETVTEKVQDVYTEMEEMLDKLFGIDNDESTEDGKENYTIVIVDSRRQENQCIKSLNGVHQIFLLNWNQEQNYLQQCRKQNFKIQEKLFASLWDGKHVEGYWLNRETIGEGR